MAIGTRNSPMRTLKEKHLNQRAKVIWFTGLSGSGKTTLSVELEKELFNKGYLTQILDGDQIRTGISNDLKFSNDDREENIRRVAETAKLFMNCGIVTICAFVSPTDKIRNIVKTIIGEENLYMVHISTPLDVCEQRDVKGLYAKVRSGKLKNFTGIDAPFESPANANLIINTSDKSIKACIEVLLEDILPLIAMD